MSNGLNLTDVECVLIKKNGEVLDMPNLYVAKDFSEGIYKNEVDRIEVKQIYQINNPKG
jgi:hypothetical protein